MYKPPYDQNFRLSEVLCTALLIVKIYAFLSCGNCSWLQATLAVEMTPMMMLAVVGKGTVGIDGGCNILGHYL